MSSTGVPSANVSIAHATISTIDQFSSEEKRHIHSSQTQQPVSATDTVPAVKQWREDANELLSLLEDAVRKRVETAPVVKPSFSDPFPLKSSKLTKPLTASAQRQGLLLVLCHAPSRQLVALFTV